MTFNYYVSFGGFSLYAVESVQDKNGRDLETYDGVGAGKFNVPNAKDPETWSIQCQLYENAAEASKYNQWRASEIFKACKSLLGNVTDPSRLVVSNLHNASANISVLAWFKSYEAEETYPGVYSVTFELEEYKPVGVKTTGIPTVARPGKLPTPPKKITITAKKTIYSTTKKYTGKSATSNVSRGAYPGDAYKSALKFKSTKTGKPTSNPATVPKNATLLCGSYVVGKTSNKTTSPYPTVKSTGQDNVIQSWFKSAGNAISSAISSWTSNAAQKKISSLG